MFSLTIFLGEHFHSFRSSAPGGSAHGSFQHHAAVALQQLWDAELLHGGLDEAEWSCEVICYDLFSFRFGGFQFVKGSFFFVFQNPK